MPSTRCIGCDSPHVSTVLYKDGPQPKEKNVTLLRCERCGLRFIEDWGKAFDADLYAYYAERVGTPMKERFHPLNTKRHRVLLDELSRVSPGRRLLDVGCGEGHLVHTALQAGWNARGIDLAVPAIQICKSFGLPCAVVDFFAPELEAQRYDVLVMSELIEHVPSPGRFLARAETLLNKGGLLYITTPNFDSLTRRIAASDWKEIHREHLSYFCRTTFLDLVARVTKLELVSLETRNVGIASLMARFRRGRPVKTSAASVPKENRTVEQSIRARVEGAPLLRAAKVALNRTLSATNLGDTMFVVLRRPVA